ncbi:hypothetical protein AA23498_2811 [Acetobacter nitrogenifigens DSM 23921 = NBRC 105050]|uniref:transposase n=1 Tax=Acetobacter nitrogenifigens TaxID=285268 RepID=UPI000429A038|nr:hypothetical protein AA23498_2811 [Acetobacter nitrogenifigens DSM 23921 = NBRC 105050]
MAQEILIGVERRRRWSDERKLEILAEVGVDGASVSHVARRHDLTGDVTLTWLEREGAGSVEFRRGEPSRCSIGRKP